MKVCHKCGVEQALTEFDAFPRNSGGLNHRCRTCERARAKAYAKTPAGRATAARYRAKPGNKLKLRAYVRGAGKASVAAKRKRYNESERGKAKRRTQTAKRDKSKVNAQSAVAKALKKGRLVRPASCEQCGNPARHASDGRNLLHAHHESYAPADRLKVRWLCHECHAAEHRMLP